MMLKYIDNSQFSEEALMFTDANRAFREGRFDEAIAAYEAAIQIHPDFYTYHENLARALERAGRYNEAMAVYRRVLELQKSSGFSKAALKRLQNVQETIKDPTSSGQNAYQYSLCDVIQTWADPEPVQLMRRVKPRDESILKSEYVANGLDQVPDTFVLYRIIGNDLYPRHAKGQSRKNVEFILKNESDFPGCSKRWLLNRIFDRDERNAIIALLNDYKQSFFEIPFLADEYIKTMWDFSLLPSVGFLSSRDFLALGLQQQDRVFTAVYAEKNRYVMNNNGARNTAIKDGKKCAKWIFPWDGNCFLTEHAWREIEHAIKAAPHLKYFAVPMARITDNNDLIRNDFVPCPVEEPQLIFRQDAAEQFNPDFPYGRRPKVELFWRLLIPGKWDRWKDDPWDQPRRSRSPEYGQFGVAGWVGRLFSGQKALEAADPSSIKNRGIVRQQAIISSINYITKALNKRKDPWGMSIFSHNALKELGTEYSESSDTGLYNPSQAIIKQAELALNRIPEAVIDKTEFAPSGDPHDYYHPAPYWWPNPNTTDGLPYIKRDGVRVPGTIMYEPESNRYDRSRLQRLFDDGITLALAWFVSGDRKYAQHAVAWLRRWFIEPDSRMNPHMIYSQVRRGHNKEEGNGCGIIEMKDLYYYLDAVRILSRSGELADNEIQEFRKWLSSYLEWLLDSRQGKTECEAVNNHGTYYDLQVAAIAAYLDDTDLLFKTLIRAHNRLAVQFSPDGWQLNEMNRTQTAHYCCFNLQGWLHLSLIAARYGDNLFNHVEAVAPVLHSGIKWLSVHFEKPWPYQQVEQFDEDRFMPLVCLARNFGLSIDLSPELLKTAHAVIKKKALFHPHDGITPYWQLCIDQGTDSVLGRVTQEQQFLYQIKNPIFHVVVMRFGIGIFDEVWLRHRFGLLASITIPSLRQQNWTKNILLLVQVDELISDVWLKRLENLLIGLPFHIQKLKLHADRGLGLLMFCGEKNASGSLYRLTTRIDDDDALTRFAINEIHNEALRAINKGVMFSAFAIEKNIRFLADRNLAIKGESKDPETAGLSLLTPADSDKTIYSYNHKKVVSESNGEGWPLFWIDESRAKNLYTIHRMSDSDYEARTKSFLEKDVAYSFTREDFAEFGIDEEKLIDWLKIDNFAPTLGSQKTLVLVGAIEKEIKIEQKRLKKVGEKTSQLLCRLYGDRMNAGSKITSLLSSKDKKIEHGIYRELLGNVLIDTLSLEERIKELAKQKAYLENLVARHADNNKAGIRSALTELLSNFFVDLAKKVKPGLILEIGAHGAEFSTRMKAQLPMSTVLAFEANPEVYSRYKENVAMHNVEYLNVIISDSDGFRTLYVPKNQSGEDKKTMGSILLDAKASAFTEYSVRSYRLDSFISESLKNIMWVDVEGACLEILNGADHLLSKCMVFYAELEEIARWEGQATFGQVVDKLGSFGLVPIIADVQRSKWQSNVLFVNKSILSCDFLLMIIDAFVNEVHKLYLSGECVCGV